MLLFCSIAPPAYISATNVGSFLAARLPGLAKSFS